MAHAFESQQKEVLALRSFVALQIDTLQDQRERLIARIDEQVDQVTDLYKSFLKHTREILPIISKHIEYKETFGILSSDVKTNKKHFQKLYDSTISRVRDIEACIPSFGDIEHHAAKAAEPLCERIYQLESMAIHPKRIEKLEREHNELFHKVEQLIDNAKKGEGYRDVMEPEVSHASVLGLPAFPAPLGESPRISSEYGRGKMKQMEETDEHFKQSQKLKLSGKGDIIAERTQPVFTVASNQTLGVFGDAGLMVSHAQRTEFEHLDKWIPKELNSWWERQKEIFIK